MTDMEKERARCLDAVTLATNEHCTCGGSPADDPNACVACKMYHDLRGLIERGNQIDPR